MIGGGTSGSRTGADGCGSVSGGNGIGPGFGFCGSDRSCGVTGGMSGFSVESVNRLLMKSCKRWFPLVLNAHCGRTMLSPKRMPLKPEAFICVDRGFSSPWTIDIRAMIRGSVDWNRPASVSARSRSVRARFASS